MGAIKSEQDVALLLARTRRKLLCEAGDACHAVAQGVQTVLSLPEKDGRKAARAALPAFRKALDTAGHRLRLFEGLLSNK